MVYFIIDSLKDLTQSGAVHGPCGNSMYLTQSAAILKMLLLATHLSQQWLG